MPTVAAPAVNKRQSNRGRLLLFALLVLVVFAALVALLYVQISRAAGRDETRPAGAIVVFGAAQYSGKPSPTLKRRLDHALDLYEHGLAPVIITTGGAGRDPKFSEGQVGRDYLALHGVPESRLIAETQSDDTLQSSIRVAAILRENKLSDCLAVSDGYHMFRVKRMMQQQGITAYASPSASPHSENLHELEEAIKFIAWKLHLE